MCKNARFVQHVRHGAANKKAPTEGRPLLTDSLLMLRCGDCQPQLPGRPVKARKKGVKGAKSVAA